MSKLSRKLRVKLGRFWTWQPQKKDTCVPKNQRYLYSHRLHQVINEHQSSCKSRNYFAHFFSIYMTIWCLIGTFLSPNIVITCLITSITIVHWKLLSCITAIYIIWNQIFCDENKAFVDVQCGGLLKIYRRLKKSGYIPTQFAKISTEFLASRKIWYNW